MAADPEPWVILLKRRKELLEQEDGMKRMELMLEQQLHKNRQRQTSVKSSIKEMEDALMMLGWMPERVNA
jgi:hypothetical protein